MYYSYYKSRITGETVSREQLLEQHRNTSFPVNWNESVYEFLQVDPIIEVPAPGETEFTTFVPGELARQLDGAWLQTWIAVDRYPTEELLVQHNQNELAEKWTMIRQMRDMLLSQTDYTQLPDTPVTDACRTAFANYRTALRNITEQSDPFNIVWPELPVYEKKIT